MNITSPNLMVDETNSSNDRVADYGGGRKSSFKDAMGAWGARDAAADGKHFLNTGRRSSSGDTSKSPIGSPGKFKKTNRRVSADDVQLSPSLSPAGRKQSRRSFGSPSSSSTSKKQLDYDGVDPRSGSGVGVRAVSASVLPDGTIPLAGGTDDGTFSAPKSPSRTRKKSSSFAQRMSAFGEGASPSPSSPQSQSLRGSRTVGGSIPSTAMDNLSLRGTRSVGISASMGSLPLANDAAAPPPPPPEEDDDSSMGTSSLPKRSSVVSSNGSVDSNKDDSNEQKVVKQSPRDRPEGTEMIGTPQKRRSSLANRISMFNSNSTLPDIARIGSNFLSPRLLKVKKKPATSPKRLSGSSSHSTKKKKSSIPSTPSLDDATTTGKTEKSTKLEKDDDGSTATTTASSTTTASPPTITTSPSDDEGEDGPKQQELRGSVGNLIDKFKQVNDSNASANTHMKQVNEQRKAQTQTTHKAFAKRAQAKEKAVKAQKKKKKNLEIVCAPKYNSNDLETFKLPTFEKTNEQADLIKEALAQNFVFDDLCKNTKELDTFVAAFEEITYSFGTKIITQGDKGDYFYIIKDGAVDFLVNDTKVGKAYEGKSFGDLALLYTAPRAASVTAASKRNASTKLFRVDQKSFRFILQNQLQESENEKRTLLKGIPFAKHLTFQQTSRLCEVMTPRMFEPEDIVVKKGEIGDAFYVLAEGTMKVTDISVGNVNYEDVELSKGDYFGERALITSEPRAANVIGVTKGTAFSIDRATFEKVLGDFSKVIMRAQDRRKLEGIKIIKNAKLESGDLDMLASLVVDKNYRRNYKIQEQGKHTVPALYLVREGVVELVKSKGEKTKRERITAGGYFGEEHLLADAQGGGDITDSVVSEYSAIATTSKPCICGVLTLEDCRGVIDTQKLDDGSFVNGDESEGMLGMLSESMRMDVDMLSGFEQVMKRRSSLRESIQGNVGLKDLNRKSVLGEGQFGEVWLVSADPFKTGDEEMEEKFALKIQSKSDEIREDVVKAIEQEIAVIQKLNHPFIVDLVTTYQDESSIYMLLGLIKGGELWNVIHQEDPETGDWTSGISEEHAKFYGLIVADTLAYMHRQNYVYRDLKPENVMIDEDGYPIIVDFGFAKYVKDKTYTFCGTPNYLAPEIVMNRGHAAGVDNWAYGVLLYEMISGENPFWYDGMDQMALFQAISTERYYPLPDSASNEAFDLIDRLLEKDPVQRLGNLAGGSKDIVNHMWFDGLVLKQLRAKEFKAPWVPPPKSAEDE